ncbi:MAG: sugar-transfer associated ATP-grasp domain-containing protein [Pseudomonadota bacterium]
MALAKKAGGYDIDLMRDMKRAQEKFGVSLSKQVMDFMAVRSLGLSFEEYLYFALFNKPRSDYSAYMGNNRARAAFYIANDLTTWDAAEDKLNFAATMAAAELPNPRIVAFAHLDRDAGGAAVLRTRGAVEEWLQTCSLPVFGKPAIASHGDGSVHITGREGDNLLLADGASVKVGDLAADIETYTDEAGFLFQEVLTPHRDIAAITDDRLATARFFVLREAEGGGVRDVVLRLPAGKNRVDNFRRDGNLVAPVDIDTGAIGVAVRGVGVAREAMRRHPDTNEAIENVTLPDFQAAKSIVTAAAECFPQQHIQSWDVAFTDSGPSLLEVNPGGNFNILQLASGRGVFDPAFRKFLEARLSEKSSADTDQKALKEAKKLLKLK